MLKVESLRFSYADKNVIDNVTFHVVPGAICGILGPNGVGKTTLIKLMTGILIQDEGNVCMNGSINPYTFDSEKRKLIGIMQEIKGIYLKMTGYEYLSFIGAMYGMTSDDIKESIHEFGKKYKMEEDVHRRINKYSAGMKKKVEFFSAVMFKPTVLFLDEPFESVDPIIQYEMKTHMKRCVGCKFQQAE